MAGRSFTDAEKATAITLARMTSVDAAAATLNIDKRTLRGWVKAAPPPTDDDGWKAAEALAQQQLLTTLATGKIKQPNLIAVVAGIATDKLWRRRRWQEREQRKAAEAQAEQPPERTPIQQVTDVLPEERTRFVRDALLRTLDRDAEDKTKRMRGWQPKLTEAEQEATLLAFLEDVRGWTDEQFAQERAELDAEIAEYETWRATNEPSDWNPSHLPAEPPAADMLPAAVPELRPQPEPPPPPNVVLLPHGEHLEDHGSWQPLERRGW